MREHVGLWEEKDGGINFGKHGGLWRKKNVGKELEETRGIMSLGEK